MASFGKECKILLQRLAVYKSFWIVDKRRTKNSINRKLEKLKFVGVDGRPLCIAAVAAVCILVKMSTQLTH